jgi:phosphate starvation-inducible protein PhoH and related proteins
MAKRKVKEKESTKNYDNFQLQLTDNQKTISNFLRENSISILSGMAGTGKDFVQLFRAVEGLLTKEFNHLVFSKPIIETGKSMGFLPGDINDKLDPYQKSFIDNLDKLVIKSKLNAIRSKISFQPVNFIRGNTFPEYSVIILSEAQNLTLHELIAFTTRLPESSKLYINCDPLQKDIRNSGIEQFLKLMGNISGVGIRELGEEFQMRHKIIVDIYKEYIKILNDKG